MHLFFCADNNSVAVSILFNYSLSSIRVPSESKNKFSSSDSSNSLAIQKRCPLFS